MFRNHEKTAGFSADGTRRVPATLKIHRLSEWLTTNIDPTNPVGIGEKSPEFARIRAL